MRFRFVSAASRKNHEEKTGDDHDGAKPLEPSEGVVGSPYRVGSGIDRNSENGAQRNKKREGESDAEVDQEIEQQAECGRAAQETPRHRGPRDFLDTREVHDLHDGPEAQQVDQAEAGEEETHLTNTDVAGKQLEGDL